MHFKALTTFTSNSTIDLTSAYDSRLHTHDYDSNLEYQYQKIEWYRQFVSCFPYFEKIKGGL
jgi:hypothetical protein